jgi:hypothetical protein
MNPILEAAIAKRRARVGCSARHTDVARGKRDAAELLHHDDPAWAYRYLTERTKYGYISTCGLEGRLYFEALGVRDVCIVCPYARRIGLAVVDIASVAIAHKAWSKDLTAMPAVGDVVRLDNPTRTNAHILVVVEIDAATGIVRSVDGGQTDNTWTAYRERILILHGGKPFLVEPKAPYVSGSPNGREVTGRVDVAALLANLEQEADTGA